MLKKPDMNGYFGYCFALCIYVAVPLGSFFCLILKK